MGILYEVMENVRSVADTVSKKTEKAVDISKLKLEETSIKSNINSKLKLLGLLVYRSRNDETDEAEKIDEVIFELESLYEELFEVQKKLDTAKGVKYCEKCGAKNTKDAVYCNKCGASLPK